MHFFHETYSNNNKDSLTRFFTFFEYFSIKDIVIYAFRFILKSILTEWVTFPTFMCKLVKKKQRPNRTSVTARELGTSFATN